MNALADELAAAAGQAASEMSGYADARKVLRRMAQFAAWEAATRHVRDFELAYVPGLLQTAEYTRRIALAAELPDPDAVVASRLDRQRTLYDQDRKFTFILAESALRWRPGPSSLMAEQAERIISVATLPNITVGVIPASRESGVLALSGFVIATPPDGAVVLVELLTGEQFIRAHDEVQAYERTFRRLAREAVTGRKAADVIRDVTLRTGTLRA